MTLNNRAIGLDLIIKEPAALDLDCSTHLRIEYWLFNLDDSQGRMHRSRRQTNINPSIRSANNKHRHFLRLTRNANAQIHFEIGFLEHVATTILQICRMNAH